MAPGAYGNLTIHPNAVVVLSAGRYTFDSVILSGRCELLTLDEALASSDESFADAAQSFVSLDVAVSSAAAVRLAVTFVTGCELSPVQLTLGTHPALP